MDFCKKILCETCCYSALLSHQLFSQWLLFVSRFPLIHSALPLKFEVYQCIKHKEEGVKKSEHDHREYRYLRLKNKNEGAAGPRRSNHQISCYSLCPQLKTTLMILDLNLERVVFYGTFPSKQLKFSRSSGRISHQRTSKALAVLLITLAM